MPISLEPSAYYPFDENYKSYFSQQKMIFGFSPNNEIKINFRGDNFIQLLKASNVRKEWVQDMENELNNEPYVQTFPRIHTDNILDENNETYFYDELESFLDFVKHSEIIEEQSINQFLKKEGVNIDKIFTEEKQLRNSLTNLIKKEIDFELDRINNHKPFPYEFNENEIVISEEIDLKITGKNLKKMKEFVFNYFEDNYPAHKKAITRESEYTKKILLNHLRLNDFQENITVEEKLLKIYEHYKNFPRILYI